MTEQMKGWFILVKKIWKKFFIVSVFIILAGIIIYFLSIPLKQTLTEIYFKEIFKQEEYVYSRNQTYSYIPMYSEKKLLKGYFIFKQDGLNRYYMNSLPYLFKKEDVTFISWGKNDDNLYLISKELGRIYFKLENENWSGPETWNRGEEDKLLIQPKE